MGSSPAVRTTKLQSPAKASARAACVRTPFGVSLDLISPSTGDFAVRSGLGAVSWRPSPADRTSIARTSIVAGPGRVGRPEATRQCRSPPRGRDRRCRGRPEIACARSMPGLSFLMAHSGRGFCEVVHTDGRLAVLSGPRSARTVPPPTPGERSASRWRAACPARMAMLLVAAFRRAGALAKAAGPIQVTRRPAVAAPAPRAESTTGVAAPGERR